MDPLLRQYYAIRDAAAPKSARHGRTSGIKLVFVEERGAVPQRHEVFHYPLLSPACARLCKRGDAPEPVDGLLLFMLMILGAF